MAYGFGTAFGTATTDRLAVSLLIDGAGASGSISCCINPNWSSGDSTTNCFWAGSEGGTDSPTFQKYSDNNIYCGFEAGGGERIVISDAGLFTSGTWANWLFTWTDGGGHFLYTNGTQVGSKTPTTAALDGSGNFYIGNFGPPAAGAGKAMMCEVAYWDAQLSAGEAAALGKFYSPALVRPASLVFYAPLVRDFIDVVGGRTITNNTALVQPHSRVIMPWRRRAIDITGTPPPVIPETLFAQACL